MKQDESKQAAHTPGKWHYDHCSEIVHIGHISTGNTICHVADPFYGQFIAQAPETARKLALALEAMENTLQTLTDWDELNEPDDGPELMHIQGLRAAIKEATQ